MDGVDGGSCAACGVGYGSQHLAKGLPEARVVGVDRDARAIGIARNRFAHSRVTILEDDCQKLGAAAQHGPFDAIVSFETLEHLPRPAEFLARCHDLLAPDGTFIISTPNSRVTAAEHASICAYHEREYTAPEFVELLHAAGFAGMTLWGQRLSALGRLRDQVRAEVNRLRSSPLVRAGRWLQTLRGRAPAPLPLPSEAGDFEVVPLGSAEECDALGGAGPLVVIAVVASPKRS